MQEENLRKIQRLQTISEENLHKMENLILGDIT